MPNHFKLPYFHKCCSRPKGSAGSTSSRSTDEEVHQHTGSRGQLVQTPSMFFKYRTTLPVPMTPRTDVSFWSILKQCVGKELSKITMPVVFNEPLSLIQRLAEYMEYSNLIDLAAKCDDPIERMEYVAAFAISALSSNWGRIGKPFNPLLGETYELCRADLGFRFVGEQVSHHPPVTAFNAEGSFYTFHGSIQPKLKFWGKTVEIVPKGVITLTLHRYKESYSWQNVTCVIHNIIVGNLWVEHCGLLEITCSKSNILASLNFKSASWFSKDLHHVEGFIYNGKRKERVMFGSWIKGMYSCSPSAFDAFSNDSAAKAKYNQKVSTDSEELQSFNFEIQGQKALWIADPRPSNAASYYQFSLYTMCLNELHPELKDKLPPTDSRFRPDIRSMEEGKLDTSAEEKSRVEEKQRDNRKEGSVEKKVPRWFSLQKISSTGREDWVFNYDYWKRNWEECVNIF